MPGLVRTRHALAIRRKSSGSPGKFQNSGGKPEPPASPADSDAATDPLDDSTSVHRRMDLLLAKSSSAGDEEAQGEFLRASTVSTVPSTVVDVESPIRSSDSPADEAKAKKVPEKGQQSRMFVQHTGESARLTTPPPTATASVSAVEPPAEKPEISTSSGGSSYRSLDASSSSSHRRPLKSAMARTCADTTAETSAAAITTTSAIPKPTTPKSVQFSNLEIRTYPVTLGDNPSVSSGPPLTLGWNYTSTHTFPVATYESQRPPASRRKLSEMALPQSLRIEMLCEDGRMSLRTIETACREVERCKRQRRRTVESLNSAWLCRAVKKMAPKNLPGRSRRE